MAYRAQARKARFRSFELDLASGELVKEGSVTRLQTQPFLVLEVLLEHAGEVVTREELERRLWPDETFVDFEHGLNKAVAKLRDALEDSGEAKLIQTLPRRGYRFIAEVEWEPGRVQRENPAAGDVESALAGDQENVAAREVEGTRSMIWRLWVPGAMLLLAVLAAVVWMSRPPMAAGGGGEPVNGDRHLSREAEHEYERGRYLLRQETDELTRAIPHFERAIALEPGYAAAYAGLGEAWGLEGVWGITGNRAGAAKALEYSRKAVDLGPDLSEAYAALGLALMQSRQWNDGEAALRRAIQLNPKNWAAKNYLSILLTQKDRGEEALALGREVAEANPVAVDFQRNYAMTLYRTRRYDEAIIQAQHVLELEPGHLAAYTVLANALLEKGRYEEAEAAFRAGGWMNPGVEAWLDALEGRKRDARKVLKDHPEVVNPHSVVARYLLGERAEAMAQLDYLANDVWNVKTYNLRTDPTFDPMRKDPEFETIVKKTGLYDN